MTVGLRLDHHEIIEQYIHAGFGEGTCHGEPGGGGGHAFEEAPAIDRNVKDAWRHVTILVVSLLGIAAGLIFVELIIPGVINLVDVDAAADEVRVAWQVEAAGMAIVGKGRGLFGMIRVVDAKDNSVG